MTEFTLPPVGQPDGGLPRRCVVVAVPLADVRRAPSGSLELGATAVTRASVRFRGRDHG